MTEYTQEDYNKDMIFIDRMLCFMLVIFFVSVGSVIAICLGAL